MSLTLDAVNGLSVAEFVAAFGDVAEHSPWVAEGAAEMRPFAERDDMVTAFASVLAGAEYEAQLALINAHPDLAGKAKLTADSASEQAGAGLDALSADEMARFTELNGRYKAKFKFPFIFAVKGATKHMILRSFEVRIENVAEVEFAMALENIKRIFMFRIEDQVQ
ncbi:MAG: 2-oxo-4-hydroxy-4-carboxy-5-ureidoimidazoline decarboxylase [Alphaproteobacteria bacterium]|nr:2-oxo-4-hydroxy-4-carboxy-5-ureidoimidazoline decarboxylase [Alphaproteobacteria bacterium]